VPVNVRSAIDVAVQQPRFDPSCDMRTSKLSQRKTIVHLSAEA